MSESKPRLLYLVTEDWAFCSHRVPTAQGAHDAGYQVGVLTRVAQHGEAITALGYDLFPLAWARRSLNPLLALRDLWQIAGYYRRLKPQVVHHVALKAVLLGGLAARLVAVPHQVAAVNGVGFIFTDAGLKARILRAAFVPLLRFVLRRPSVQVWFQNQDDRALFITLGIVADEQTILLRGSGVDTDKLQPLPEPDGAVTCAYAGRMLHSKGIDLLVEAQQACRNAGVALNLLLAGLPDDNPTSFSATQLENWAKLPGVSYLGQVKNIGDLWARAHIAVLPCRVREGLPKTLLDAAACGRPIVASDLAGVREIAQPGNALLVPPNDVFALTGALKQLATDAPLRAKLGAAGRALVMGEMAASAIRGKTAAIYRNLLPR